MSLTTIITTAINGKGFVRVVEEGPSIYCVMCTWKPSPADYYTSSLDDALATHEAIVSAERDNLADKR